MKSKYWRKAFVAIAVIVSCIAASNLISGSEPKSPCVVAYDTCISNAHGANSSRLDLSTTTWETAKENCISFYNASIAQGNSVEAAKATLNQCVKDALGARSGSDGDCKATLDAAAVASCGNTLMSCQGT